MAQPPSAAVRGSKRQDRQREQPRRPPARSIASVGATAAYLVAPRRAEARSPRGRSRASGGGERRRKPGTGTRRSEPGRSRVAAARKKAPAARARRARADDRSEHRRGHAVAGLARSMAPTFVGSTSAVTEAASPCRLALRVPLQRQVGLGGRGLLGGWSTLPCAGRCRDRRRGARAGVVAGDRRRASRRAGLRAAGAIEAEMAARQSLYSSRSAGIFLSAGALVGVECFRVSRAVLGAIAHDVVGTGLAAAGSQRQQKERPAR